MKKVLSIVLVVITVLSIAFAMIATVKLGEVAIQNQKLLKQLDHCNRDFDKLNKESKALVKEVNRFINGY